MDGTLPQDEPAPAAAPAGLDDAAQAAANAACAAKYLVLFGEGREEARLVSELLSKVRAFELLLRLL
jgi:hypothetical protein